MGEIQANINQLATKLKNQTELTKKEIRENTEKTIQEYKPLITKKKPALIFYAQQQGIQLIQTKPPSLDIENIVPDMNNINIKCQVKNIDKFTYTKKGEKRQGCDITLKDQTATISLMIWGEQVDNIDSSLKGEKVEIKNSYSSEYQGEVQLQYSEDTVISRV